MRLEWDEAKNRSNLRKHGFDFADAEEFSADLFLFGRIPSKTMARSDGLELG